MGPINAELITCPHYLATCKMIRILFHLPDGAGNGRLLNRQKKKIEGQIATQTPARTKSLASPPHPTAKSAPPPPLPQILTTTFRSFLPRMCMTQEVSQWTGHDQWRRFH